VKKETLTNSKNSLESKYLGGTYYAQFNLEELKPEYFFLS